MEKRWGSRIAASINAVIHYRSAGLLYGQISNYSLSGLCFLVDPLSRPVIPLPLNAVADLAFVAPSDGIIRCMSVQVVHHTGSRVGMMFTEIDDHILHIMSAPRPEAGAAPRLQGERERIQAIIGASVAHRV
jgi:hypothetical protein